MAGTAPLTDRRRFLLSSGAAVAAAGAAYALPGPRGGNPPALARPAAADTGALPARPAVGRAAPYGATTLQTTARLTGSGGYRHLTSGPGWPLVVRGELATARGGREDRRTALACFVQLTDLHVADVQSPLRTEYLRAGSPGSWRGQEALSVAGAVSLVEQVNALGAGPHTSRPPAFVMSTGDNIDNHSMVELEWFLTLMSGGRITPNTGDPAAYEGVQNCGLPLYWHPDTGLRDQDKLRGMPRIPGYLEAAIRPVTSPGLHIPWYSTPGNHDDLPGGCLAPQDPFLSDYITGARKLFSVPDADVAAFAKVLDSGDDPKSTVLKEILHSNARRARSVTPDPRRRLATPHDYLRAHLDPAYAGAGPVGHGYTENNLDGERMYYTFPIADGVLGISIDTTYRSGHYEGSLGTEQLRWLEQTLAAHSARHYDADGRPVRNASADDAHLLVFSHHHSPSMTRRPDAARTDEVRHDGAEVIALLSRFPNVVAWINGHSHINRITPHAHPTPARSFWEVNTASHVDYPQHARLLELVDNQDGTLSLFTTLVESAAPHRADFHDLSAVGLASLYRELAYNAPGLAARTGSGAYEEMAGRPADRNTELLVRRA
ncbi:MULTISPECIES: TIGR03767 family metallophosphoesterase [unclassified Streptomyces]|uniref:TIGR03767 family metallophosphoesterase n=1 Tax=unclassified Streptomyces TaxID=2593676 RepID=UPI0003717E2C|nr:MULTISPECIES: TIGR03767 family metallophosphoesterase [unclassified Streptomyces]MYT28525.1 TIGR03767 family metallophosphoesterase [Streptomyces sp. SID8354]